MELDFTDNKTEDDSKVDCIWTAVDHFMTFFLSQSKVLDFLKCILYSAKMYIHTSMKFENAHINKENPIGKWGETLMKQPIVVIMEAKD